MKGVPDSDDRWDIVLERNRSYDGIFYYAVRTTGIYCRPSCPSKRPNQANVSYFGSVKAAEAAGFRPCKRCRPASEAPSRGEAAIQDARRFLDDHLDEVVPLANLASEVGLSPHHLHRTFTRMVGLTPKAYHDARRFERLKEHLRNGDTVCRATFEAGFGSSRAVYEKADAGLGMSPATYRRGGQGTTIRYVTRETTFGPLLLAATERGICTVTLGLRVEDLIEDLRDEFPRATFEPDDESLSPWAEALLSHLDGAESALDLPVDLSGTEFQMRVWRALREIPFGETSSYGELARAIGRPGSARAVARACATNRVALVVPCHRVIRANGDAGGYRWGESLKRRLLDRERELAQERRRRDPDPTG